MKNLKLKPTKFALAAAILVAAFVLILTAISIIKPFGHNPDITSFFYSIYGGIGYSITWLGAFIGAIFAFIDTFIFAFIFAWLYNKLL